MKKREKGRRRKKGWKEREEDKGKGGGDTLCADCKMCAGSTILARETLRSPVASL